MGHRGIRSEDTLEYRIAKTFCLENSKYDSEVQECVFVGLPEQVVAYVRTVIPDAYIADVPDTPQGLVLTDNRGTGVFQ